MKYIVSGEEMSRIDEYTINNVGLPQMVLMERAALEIADFIKSKFSKSVRILVGVESGNNGGDGIATARILKSEGYDIEVYWVDGLGKTSPAFEQQRHIAKKLGVKFIDEIVDYGYDIVIDGIFGVGLNRTVTGKQAEAINMINDIDAYTIAIDIPSGIDSYTGFVLGSAVRADATITFEHIKIGMLMGIGYEYSGQVVIANIGFPKQAVDFVEPRLYTYEESDIDRLLPFRKSDSHKGSYGKISIIGGRKNMAGAPMFSAEASYRMGCGLVKICTVEENRAIIQTKLPEAMLTTYD
ncbi:MAG: NAD(P)H-hydrate epimerase [Lachnospiraceae bacterium]|nr:NAD(P)H-hydrate epimerase [Lachnospiraceae bacterium]